jgi:hypothetical protein
MPRVRKRIGNGDSLPDKPISHAPASLLILVQFVPSPAARLHHWLSSQSGKQSLPCACSHLFVLIDRGDLCHGFPMASHHVAMPFSNPLLRELTIGRRSRDRFFHRITPENVVILTTIPWPSAAARDTLISWHIFLLFARRNPGLKSETWATPPSLWKWNTVRLSEAKKSFKDQSKVSVCVETAQDERVGRLSTYAPPVHHAGA